jgi:hypothetical protein
LLESRRRKRRKKIVRDVSGERGQDAQSGPHTTSKPTILSLFQLIVAADGVVVDQNYM